MKGLAWEGGIRVDCLVWGSWLPKGEKRDGLIHVSDWLLTLPALANAKINLDREIDGLDLSEMILNKKVASVRTEIENIDDVFKTTAIIKGEYKLVNSSFFPTSLFSIF